MSQWRPGLFRAALTGPEMTTEIATARRRWATYWIIGIGLAVPGLFGNGIDWRGSAQLHTVMETASTLLAVLIGVMALVRYYSRPASLFLFIGAGFIGTAFLDGFHTIVTSTYFKPMMPSDLPSLIPWSWVASRQFLAILMFLSWLDWLRENRLGSAGRNFERVVYTGTAIFTLASFLFFAFVPLPRAYYPELLFQRPEEFAPALFFLLALIGYLRKGRWRNDAFEHWLVLSLIVGFVGQAAYMSLSGQLFDYEFDLAHALKKVSYICVLSGLLINMYVVFRREVATTRSLKASENRVRAIVDNIFDGIITINDRGIIQSINPATEEIFGYPASQLIARNIKMLTPEPHRSAHDGYIQNYLNTGEAKIIGIGREVEGQRADGSTFPMELEIAELWVAGERLFLGIVRDITERKKADQAKSDFVSTVSHELRTPLTSIKGSLGLIRSGSVGQLPEKLESMLEIAYNNSDRLVLLINDILDMDKINAGKMDFQMLPMEVISLIDDAIEANKGYGEEYGVSFVRLGLEEPALVLGDKDRLMQVMSNLMSNAAKFSPEGETVELSVSRRQDLIRVAVRDKGPGVSDEFKADIFEKFSQADSSDTRQKGGTGLGLSITKAIVKRHGGTIGFDSRAGSGATFYIDLPQLERPPEVSPPSANDDGKPRILHVEDNEDVRRVIAALLAGTAQVITAGSIGEARDLLRRQEFDLVILDLILPDGDGETLLPLPARPGRSRTPAIVFSVNDVSPRTTTGIKAVLVKSQTSNEHLLQTIRAVIEAGMANSHQEE